MSKRPTDSPLLGKLPKDAKTEEFCISFFDLSRFAAWGSSEQDEKVATFMQEFYEMSEAQLAPTGARIVKFIGEAHGVSDGVVSQPGSGSTFTVKLPEENANPPNSQQSV